MAKTRAQRKAERRAREERAAREAQRSRDADSRAQARTQVPESADVIEAELAEEGADLDELATESPDGAATQEAEAPPKKERRGLRSLAPSRADVGKPQDAAPAEAPAKDKISRRAQRREERERERRRRESAKRRERLTPLREVGAVVCAMNAVERGVTAVHRKAIRDAVAKDLPSTAYPTTNAAAA